MGNKWDKMNKASVPELSTITEWVNDELWNDLLAYMDTTYKARISIDYSGCGMAPGWNVKFKKAGKSLCTLYPQEGWFVALVVIGQKEKSEMEETLWTFTEYTQNLYRQTKEGMGQRWLMFEVKNAEILEDVKRGMMLRRKVS